MIYSAGPFKSRLHLVPILGDFCIQAVVSVAGLGVRGPSGPRGGMSIGIFPGSSSGTAGAPGSRTGGGISGFGLPGGMPGGGSAGVPGVAGGISGGSIGISFTPLNSKRDNGAEAAKFPIGRAMELPHAGA